MISLMFSFWLFLGLFGLIGAMRGWAKELLVIFSIILALFLIYVLEAFTPFMVPFEELYAQVESLDPGAGFSTLPVSIQEEVKVQFWVRAAIVAVCCAGLGERVFYRLHTVVLHGSGAVSLRTQYLPPCPRRSPGGSGDECA
mgnify:CR=1 FL=1